MEQEAKKYMRDTEGAWIAGVCSGLAKHWNTDPMLVRVLTVALSLAVGIFPLVYVIFGFFAPAAPLAHGKESTERRWLLWLMVVVLVLPIFAAFTFVTSMMTGAMFFQGF